MGTINSDEVVVGVFEFVVKDAIWSVEYVFHPSHDTTFFALIKYLNDGSYDILDHFGNFYRGWYGVEDARKTAISFIEQKFGEELEIIVSGSGRNEVVAKQIIKFVEDGKVADAVKFIGDNDLLLTDFEDMLSKLEIENKYSGKIEEYLEKMENSTEEKKDVEVDATLNDIVMMIRKDEIKDAVKIINNEGWEFDTIYNELYASRLYNSICKIEKYMARKSIKKMIKMINDGISYGDLAFDSSELWDSGVHTAHSYTDIMPPFDYSFDEYDDEWYIQNKQSIVKWLKRLSKAMKK